MVTGALFGAGMGIKDALIFSAPPPADRGHVDDRRLRRLRAVADGNDYAGLEEATQPLVAAAARAAGLRASPRRTPRRCRACGVDIDRDQAKLLGVNLDA